MKAKINKNIVKSIIAKDKQYEIRDTDLKGFAIRVFPSGNASYIIWYARGKAAVIGRVNELSTMQARNKATEILGNFKTLKIDPIFEKRKDKEIENAEKLDSLTFGQFVENDYFPFVMTNHKAGKETVNKIKRHFLPKLKDKKLADISAWDIDKWRSRKLKEGLKMSTINRELTALKASLYKAVEWKLIDKNPIAASSGFKFKRVDSQPNVRFLTDDEEKRLRDALGEREKRIRDDRDNANLWRAERGYKQFKDLKDVKFADHLKPLVLLSLHTGARRGELFNLKWPDVDFSTKNVTIQGAGTKSGKTLHIPLNEEAIDILQQWKKQSGNDLVFPGKNGNKLTDVKSAWTKVLKEADINNFRWHDMRHTFASNLVMSGVDLTTVRELLGHADFKMTLRYSHLGDHIKRQAVAKLVRKKRLVNEAL
jgi:integrase